MAKKDDLGLKRPTIPVAYPRLLLNVLRQRGIEDREARAGTGLRDVMRAQPDERVAPAQWGRLVLNAIRLSGDPGIGFELGLQSRAPVHGFMGYAAMTAQDLRSSLELTTRYFRMRNRQYRIALDEDERGASLALQAVRRDPVLQHHLMFEFVLTGLAQTIPTLTGASWSGAELHFTWPEPAHYRHYRARLPPVRFGRASNALWVPAAALSLPLLMADELAHREALAQVEREYATVRYEEGNVAERVRAELVLTAEGYPSVDDLARRLLTSARSLRRRLQLADTSYRALLEEARFRDAKQLLSASDLEVQAIAARLRYTDQANFTRAFKRWAGMTPSEFRASKP